MTDSLDDIIKGCVSGRSNAREKLYNLYSGKMWAVCLRYTHNYDEAKDVLQDGFIKIFEKISQFEGRGHFEGWMRRIIVNTALASYRKHNYLNIDSTFIPSNNEEIIENIECDLSAQDLMKIIQELPPQYRTVFNLYAIEGYAHKEIAEMLGINEGTSKSNLSRARDILQKKVQALYPLGIKLG